jgi:hypothetical protein
LAEVARLYEPGNIIGHEGPPEALGDELEGREVSAVSDVVVRGRHDEDAARRRDYELVFAFSIFTP